MINISVIRFVKNIYKNYIYMLVVTCSDIYLYTKLYVTKYNIDKKIKMENIFVSLSTVEFAFHTNVYCFNTQYRYHI